MKKWKKYRALFINEQAKFLNMRDWRDRIDQRNTDLENSERRFQDSIDRLYAERASLVNRLSRLRKENPYLTELKEKQQLLENANKTLEEVNAQLAAAKHEIYSLQQGREGSDWFKEHNKVMDQLKQLSDVYGKLKYDHQALLFSLKEQPKKFEPSTSRGDNSTCKNCGRYKWQHDVGYVCKKTNDCHVNFGGVSREELVKGEWKGPEINNNLPILVRVKTANPWDWYNQEEYEVENGSALGPDLESQWVIREDFLTHIYESMRFIPKAVCEIVRMPEQKSDVVKKEYVGPTKYWNAVRTDINFHDQVCRNCGMKNAEHAGEDGACIVAGTVAVPKDWNRPIR